MLLPYAGQKVCTLVKSLKTHLKKRLPSNVKVDIIYTNSKLSFKFNVKDKIPFEEQHDILYRSVCATDNCIEDYVEETNRCIVERSKYHSGWDQHSRLVKLAVENKHLPLKKGEFTLLDSDYRNNTRERKKAEALIINTYLVKRRA